MHYVYYGSMLPRRFDDDTRSPTTHCALAIDLHIHEPLCNCRRYVCFVFVVFAVRRTWRVFLGITRRRRRRSEP